MKLKKRLNKTKNTTENKNESQITQTGHRLSWLAHLFYFFQSWKFGLLSETNIVVFVYLTASAGQSLDISSSC